MFRFANISLALAALAIGASPGQAQIVATIGWQTQPFCNVVTLTFIQQGGMYQVTGTDDGCGGVFSTVNGTAVPAGDNVAVGFTVNLPSGRAAHITASIRLRDAAGTWTDADGTTGAFALHARSGGAPRPLPAGSTAITATQFAPSVYPGTGAAATVARSDHDHDARYYTKTFADTTYLASARVLSAVIEFDGTTARGTHVVSSARLANGLYEVVFDRAVNACVYSASAGGTRANLFTDRVATVSARVGNANGVTILTATLAAASADSSFHLVVVCP